MERAPMGKILLLRMKSTRSKIPLPAICTSARGPKLRVQGRERIKIAIPFLSEAVFFSRPNSSIEKARMFSNTAITVLRDAKERKMKN
jgi:hypothetical protein